MATLKSFGCSFIFGSDLLDNTANSEISAPSQRTWPAHVARHLNVEYECHAMPGSGNLQILERLLNQLPTTTSSDLIVVGWTWIDRFDYYHDNHDSASGLSPWITIMPTDDTDLAKTYYQDLHSEYKDKFNCLSYIKLAIDSIKQKNIPFVMTYMDRLLFDKRWNTSPSILEMQSLIEPYMTMFDSQTFLEWSRKHNYPESANWHPLEEAHQNAFEFIKTLNLKLKI
jgi:hypothetical protein